MYYVFNKSCIGYSHLRNKKPCQDYSASYKDSERIIITCCDGHGGDQYVRSQYGSKAASDAVMNVFKSIDNAFLRSYEEDKLIEKIKLLILCEYNKLIEREVSEKPIRRKELEGLKEEQIDALKFNPAKAYGTTLTGALQYKNKYVVVGIGDTETLGIKDGNLIKIFDNSDDPAGNVTYSMCQEDAYQYLRVAILNSKEVDGILLCTDGLSSPYQSYDNFVKSFIRPTFYNLLNSKSTSGIDRSVDQLALELGVGDDVSLAFIFDENVSKRKYK